MSPVEQVLLNKGRIPAQIVLSEIRLWRVAVSPDDPSAEFPLRVLAEKSGLSFHTFITWLDEERVQSIAFDDVDRIFVAMGKPFLWLTKYADYYYACNLAWTRCACPGCDVMFRPKHAANGPTGQRYCSTACRNSAKAIRQGKSKRLVKRHRGQGSKLVCRNGHVRTPETTKIRNDQIECRVCVRASAKRSYERKMGRAS